MYKGTLLGTPNREPQEYSRNLLEYKDPGRYIPIIFLLYSWGSWFGVPSKVPFMYVYFVGCSLADANAISAVYSGRWLRAAG